MCVGGAAGRRAGPDVSCLYCRSPCTSVLPAPQPVAWQAGLYGLAAICNLTACRFFSLERCGPFEPGLNLWDFAALPADVAPPFSLLMNYLEAERLWGAARADRSRQGGTMTERRSLSAIVSTRLLCTGWF